MRGQTTVRPVFARRVRRRYEYCYPLSLTQFHVQQNGKKQDAPGSSSPPASRLPPPCGRWLVREPELATRGRGRVSRGRDARARAELPEPTLWVHLSGGPLGLTSPSTAPGSGWPGMPEPSCACGLRVLRRWCESSSAGKQAPGILRRASYSAGTSPTFLPSFFFLLHSFSHGAQEGEHILGTIEGNKLAIMPNRVNMSIARPLGKSPREGRRGLRNSSASSRAQARASFTTRREVPSLVLGMWFYSATSRRCLGSHSYPFAWYRNAS